MKVGQPPSCGVTGASRTNFASRAGLTWNMVAWCGGCKLNMIIRINRKRNSTSKALEASYILLYAIPVGSEAGGSLLTKLRLVFTTPPPPVADGVSDCSGLGTVLVWGLLCSG